MSRAGALPAASADVPAVLTALAAAGAALAMTTTHGGSADEAAAAWWEPPVLVAVVLTSIAVVAGGFAAMRGGGYARWSLDATAARGVGGVLLALVLVAVVGLRAQQDVAGLHRALPTELDTTAELGSDPEPSRFGTRVELIADGRRYTTTVDRSLEGALREARSGDRLHLVGTPRKLPPRQREWAMSRHLAGRLTVRELSPLPGTRIWFRAANGVHELLERGSASLSGEQQSLYLGLVVGDDRGQSELTRFRFRASGLTHLLAVSGQNLVFLMAVLAPLARRLVVRWRVVVAVAAGVGFIVVTRAEPSVLRAAVMAALVLSSAAAGRRSSGLRVLSMSVCALLVADPLLVWSVGFRLSVAATLGLVVLARPLSEWIPGPGWLRVPLAVTVAAQIGALAVMTLTFGPVSLLAVPANVLAEPAAGAVMTFGMSGGLLAGVVREELAGPAMLPVRWMLWWIDSVATVISGLSAPPVGLLGWSVVLAAAALSVALWRRHGPRALGRVAVCCAAPLVVLVRPAEIASAGVTVGEAVVVPGCDGPVAVLEDNWVDERSAVDVLEGLWRLGVTSVGHLEAPGGGPGAAMLRDVLVDPGRGPPGHLCRRVG